MATTTSERGMGLKAEMRTFALRLLVNGTQTCALPRDLLKGLYEFFVILRGFKLQSSQGGYEESFGHSPNCQASI